MIYIQLLSRDGENMQSLIRTAIAEGQIKSFKTRRVVGGLQIVHKKHPGTISFEKTRGPLVATISCTNTAKEWQLLEAFVGRMAYHFSGEMAGINVQFLPKE